jgi:hypothetical protein
MGDDGSVIDHIVYATPDLDVTVAVLRDRTGVALSEGGRHLGAGTRNYLADLGDGAYLEVIGPDPEQPLPADPRPFGLDEIVHPALVAWAVRVTDIDAAIATARDGGWDPGAAMAMSRQRPDGVVLQWRLTWWTPPHPFLIDWGLTDRVTTLHPSQSAATGLTLVSLTVPEIPAALTDDRRLVRGAHLGATVDSPRGRIVL